MDVVSEKREEIDVQKVMEESLGGAFISELVPKLVPFVYPLLDKLENFMGDDDKIIVLRKLNGQCLLFILDTKRGLFTISNSAHSMEESVYKDENGKDNIYPIKDGLDLFMSMIK